MPEHCEWIATEIPGVTLAQLTPHRDDRGDFTELFREAWTDAIEPSQWNLVRSRPQVLRGVHVHLKHVDYLHAAMGTMLIGMCDLRSESPTFRKSLVLELSSDRPQGLVIPSGVAHGFYHTGETIHVYAMDRYFGTDPHLGCRWDDPEMAIPWPTIDPIISPRDAELPNLHDLMADFEPQRAKSLLKSGT